MRVADRLARHGAQAEPLRGVVGRLLQPAVVEHQHLGLAVFEEQLAVIGAVEAAGDDPVDARAIEAGAVEQRSGREGHGRVPSERCRHSDRSCRRRSASFFEPDGGAAPLTTEVSVVVLVSGCALPRRGPRSVRRRGVEPCDEAGITWNGRIAPCPPITASRPSLAAIRARPGAGLGLGARCSG